MASAEKHRSLAGENIGGIGTANLFWLKMALLALIIGEGGSWPASSVIGIDTGVSKRPDGKISIIGTLIPAAKWRRRAAA